jgi:hypothetical protein
MGVPPGSLKVKYFWAKRRAVYYVRGVFVKDLVVTGSVLI